jgi:hypothetical protein
MSAPHPPTTRRLGLLTAVLLLVSVAACADATGPTDSRDEAVAPPKLGIDTSPGTGATPKPEPKPLPKQQP